MEGKYYSSERSIQLLISLLKQHNIKKIVASPGATNLSFVASLQQDSWFEMYSSVDERSAGIYRMRYGGGIGGTGRVDLYGGDRFS